jgi:hypothetical protein
LAAWLTISSMAHSAKSTTRSSTTGRQPASAMPTAAPTMVASEIGVSMTRPAPKRCASGVPSASRYWPNTPPRPRSSPRAMTVGSCSIVCARAREAACA